jgi:hypothetical protein
VQNPADIKEDMNSHFHGSKVSQVRKQRKSDDKLSLLNTENEDDMLA